MVVELLSMILIEDQLQRTVLETLGETIKELVIRRLLSHQSFQAIAINCNLVYSILYFNEFNCNRFVYLLQSKISRPNTQDKFQDLNIPNFKHSV